MRRRHRTTLGEEPGTSGVGAGAGPDSERL